MATSTKAAFLGKPMHVNHLALVAPSRRVLESIS